MKGTQWKLNSKHDVLSFSSFSITFSENQSDMRLNTSNVDEFLPLLNIPTKPPGNFLTISDILANGQKLKGQFVNLLAAVHEVRSDRVLINVYQFRSRREVNF